MKLVCCDRQASSIQNDLLIHYQLSCEFAFPPLGQEIRSCLVIITRLEAAFSIWAACTQLLATSWNWKWLLVRSLISLEICHTSTHIQGKEEEEELAYDDINIER
jgi:hypothetical protein